MNPKIEKEIEGISKYAEKPLDELKSAINRSVTKITGSTLSYFATVGNDEKSLEMIGWSKPAMINCTTIDKPIFYKLEDTGLWGDAIRERKPVITNDYKSLVKPTKKGYPHGHVMVRKHMNLPVFEGGKMVLVVGVGNKTADYTTSDADAVRQYMDAVWPHLKKALKK